MPPGVDGMRRLLDVVDDQLVFPVGQALGVFVFIELGHGTHQIPFAIFGADRRVDRPPELDLVIQHIGPDDVDRAHLAAEDSAIEDVADDAGTNPFSADPAPEGDPPD